MKHILIFLSLCTILATISCSDKYDSEFNFVGKWEGIESRDIFIDSVYSGTVQFDVQLKIYADGTGTYDQEDKERANLYWKYDEEIREMILFVESHFEVERGATYPFFALRFNVILNGDETQQWTRTEQFYSASTQEMRETQIEWNLTND